MEFARQLLRARHNWLSSLFQQAKVEEEEEFITNNLLKRLEVVKKEKEHLAKQVEIEEEFMTNNLQKKLSKVCCTMSEKTTDCVPYPL